MATRGTISSSKRLTELLDSKTDTRKRSSARPRRDHSPDSNERKKSRRVQKPSRRSQSKSQDRNHDKKREHVDSSNEREFKQRCEDIENDILGFDDNDSPENTKNLELKKNYSKEDISLKKDKSLMSKDDLRKIKSSHYGDNRDSGEKRRPKEKRRNSKQ